MTDARHPEHDMSTTPHSPTTPTTPMSRRHFMAATTAAIPASAALAHRSRSTSPRVAPLGGRGPEPLRVGLIGCGSRGSSAAMQALAADEGAVLHALADAFPEKAERALANIRTEIKRRAAARDGKPIDPARVDVTPDRVFVGLDAYKSVVACCDVVLLCTPPCFRPAHLRAAVDAGRHVFCEKPVAVDGPGCRSVFDSVELAVAKGLSVVSGFCWRHQLQVRECLEHLLAGGAGDIRSIQTTYNTTGWLPPNTREPQWSDAEFQLRNWQYFTPISGDHIVEQAVHALDWMCWAMRDEPPVRCFAVGGRMTRANIPETGNVYDNFGVVFEYRGGVRGYHTCRHWPATPGNNTAYFLGSAGSCSMDPWNGKCTVTPIGAQEAAWVGSFPGNDMYQEEHNVLFQAIRAGSPVNEGVRMTRSTLVSIMARLAAYTGQVVTWEQALSSQEDLNPQPWAMGPRPTPTLAIPGTHRLT